MLLRLSTILGPSGNGHWFEIYFNYNSIVKITDLCRGPFLEAPGNYRAR